MKEFNAEDLKTMSQFLSDNTANSAVMSAETAAKLEELHIKYRKSHVQAGDVVLCVEAGKYGNVEMYNIQVSNKEELELVYEPGNNQYISMEGSVTTILWTDYSSEQPYNRQGALYVGYNWNNLNFVGSTVEYREFKSNTRPTRSSFPVWGFIYNEYWNNVHFGICIAGSNLPGFLTELRELLGKPEIE